MIYLKAEFNIEVNEIIEEVKEQNFDLTGVSINLSFKCFAFFHVHFFFQVGL